MELLYEEEPERRLEGAHLVLALARYTDTQRELLRNSTLLGALARVLREDFRRSSDLAGALIQIFFWCVGHGNRRVASC